MAARIIKLLAPNNLPLVGILLEDGSACEFEYTYDDVYSVCDMVIKSDGSTKILNRNGGHVFVDTAGNEWPASAIDMTPS